METCSTNFGYQMATVLVVTALMGWGLPVVAKEKLHDPSRPKRIVLDHDGTFEDFYAITAAALESQRKHPSIQYNCGAGPEPHSCTQGSLGFSALGPAL